MAKTIDAGKLKCPYCGEVGRFTVWAPQPSDGALRFVSAVSDEGRARGEFSSIDMQALACQACLGLLPFALGAQIVGIHA